VRFSLNPLRREITARTSNCALCGSNLNWTTESIESVVCDGCQCTKRCEAVARAILTSLGYPPNATLESIAPDLSRIGLGISDDWRLALRLANRFDYTNSFLHRYPFLDLAHPPDLCKEFFEFIVCSDVLEHTRTRFDPITGIYSMLRPGGFAVITVPSPATEDQEFYPDLETYSVNGGHVHWVNKQGKTFVDTNPEFHGGSGTTLAFRRISLDQLLGDLKSFGFKQTAISPKFSSTLSALEVPLVVAWK